jgi:hypothetical protein
MARKTVQLKVSTLTWRSTMNCSKTPENKALPQSGQGGSGEGGILRPPRYSGRHSTPINDLPEHKPREKQHKNRLLAARCRGVAEPFSSWASHSGVHQVCTTRAPTCSATGPAAHPINGHNLEAAILPLPAPQGYRALPL